MISFVVTLVIYNSFRKKMDSHLPHYRTNVKCLPSSLLKLFYPKYKNEKSTVLVHNKKNLIFDTFAIQFYIFTHAFKHIHTYSLIIAKKKEKLTHSQVQSFTTRKSVKVRIQTKMRGNKELPSMRHIYP